MKLKGRVAIVTGAAQGIGRAAAARLAQDGARVALVDRNRETGAQAAQDLREAGGETMFIAADVTDESDVADVLAETERRFGPVDALVNNAGVYRAFPLLDMTRAQFDDVIAINLTSVFLFSQAVARRLAAVGRPGAIVNISSINARMSSPLATAYSASKGGVSAFTAAAALALVEHGIRVNAIAPGTIATPLVESIATQPDVYAQTLSRIPMARLGAPEEIAATASFLLSDDASYITGQTIFVDGGRTALSITMPARKPGATS